MAHNLEQRNGRTSFVSAREIAWHGLGTILPDRFTSEEAIKYANLDYEVALAKLKASIEIPVNDINSFKDSEIPIKDVEVENKFATYRKDTGDIFGIVGGRYTIVQNTEAFTFFDGIVGQGEAIFETAGALGNGETIFVSAKLPSHITVGKDDIIDKYLLFTMSHDGSSAIQAMFTPIRVVCNNTLQAALSQRARRVTIRHTKSAHVQLRKAQELLGLADKLSYESSQLYNAMSNIFVPDSITDKWLDSIFLTDAERKELPFAKKREDVVSTRKQNIINDVKAYTRNGIGQDTETTRGTLFGLYNGITGYYQNMKNYKTSETMFENTLGSNDIIDTAFALSVKSAKAGNLILM